MTPEQRKVEELERKIDAQSAAISDLKTAVAVLVSKLSDVGDDVKEAKRERSGMQTELRTVGIKNIDTGNAIKEFERTLNRLEPIVVGLHTERQMGAGAWKLASFMARGLYVAGGAIAAFVVWIVTEYLKLPRK